MKLELKTEDKLHFPKWLRKPIPLIGKKNKVERYIKNNSLNTVCEEAKCPNRNECYGNGTATFLLMGDTCTRNCLFCNVSNGIPFPLDKNEPESICKTVKLMGLSYVVLTSVTRDDLDDGGAKHIADTVKKLKKAIPKIKVEVLVPDFHGNRKAINYVLESKPDVFNHNIETVHSIFTRIRPDASYTLSLKILKDVANSDYQILTKSGFMVGLGETEDEVVALMEDLKNANVNIITIGQYLQPSSKQVKVKEFITHNQFNKYRLIGKKIGFDKIISGPFVRSSYKAEKILT